MTDVPLLKMKEDVQEDEAKENNFNDFTKAFATPSTVKRKSARRSLGVFTTPTAYYQGLLTDFGSVYRSKACSMFRTPHRTSDNCTISEFTCGKVDSCKIIESGIFSNAESMRNNHVINSVDLLTETKIHDSDKNMISLSDNLSSVPEKPDILNDHQEFTNVSMKGTCSVDDYVNVNETESRHDLVEHCELQSNGFDNDVQCFLKSHVDSCKPDDAQEDVIGISENSATSSFEITSSKEPIIDSQHAENYQDFDSEAFIKGSKEIPHKQENNIDCIDMMKDISDTAKDCHEHKNELTLESVNGENTTEIVKVVSAVVLDSCQGSMDTKDDDSQNTEDSGLFSLSSSIDVNDKIELGNKCDLNDVPEPDVHTINAISTDEHLSESGKNEIVSDELSLKTTECSNIENDNVASIVEKFDQESAESVSTELSNISPHQSVEDEKMDNEINRDIISNAGLVCESENIVMDLEPSPNSLKCADTFENVVVSQDILSSREIQQSVTNFDQGVSTLFDDVEFNLFNESEEKKKRKDTSRKGRRKSIRLQLREINCGVQGKLVRIKEDAVANNPEGDNITSDIDSMSQPVVEGFKEIHKQETTCSSKIKTNPKSERIPAVESSTGSIEGECLSQPVITGKDLINPIQDSMANIKHNRQKKRKNGRFRKKKNKKKGTTINRLFPSDTNCVENLPAVITDEITKDVVNNSPGTTPDDAARIQQYGSNLQEPSSSTHSPKDLSRRDADIFNEFDGLDDLDIFKEVTETNTKEKNKSRRAQKRTMGEEKNARRRSARLAGLTALDNIFVCEQLTEEPNNSYSEPAALENLDESEKTEEACLTAIVSPRKIRKLKRTSFGKPLMLLNMFGTVYESMNDDDDDETCDAESLGTMEHVDDQTDRGGLDVLVYTCTPECTTNRQLTKDSKTDSPKNESSTVFNIDDMPKDLVDMCDEQHSRASATLDPSGWDVFIDSEPNSSMTDFPTASGDLSGNDTLMDLTGSLEEDQSVKRQSSRRKKVFQPIPKPKKKETLEKAMSIAEIEQLYLNKGYSSKVIKPNLLETIFEASQNPAVAINIGKKKLNRKVTFQCPWLPRKRNNKKKGKRLIVKTRKFKISDQLLVDKLDDVLCDLDAFETLLL